MWTVISSENVLVNEISSEKMDGHLFEQEKAREIDRRYSLNTIIQHVSAGRDRRARVKEWERGEEREREVVRVCDDAVLLCVKVDKTDGWCSIGNRSYRWIKLKAGIEHRFMYGHSACLVNSAISLARSSSLSDLHRVVKEEVQKDKLQNVSECVDCEQKQTWYILKMIFALEYQSSWSQGSMHNVPRCVLSFIEELYRSAAPLQISDLAE